MKAAAVLLCAIGLCACAFPEYKVEGGEAGATGSMTSGASCMDGERNGDESDRDCGGTQGCARCMPNQLCGSASDCDGGLCTTGRCQAASCKDELQNAAETDLDCGGPTCSPCAVRQSCMETADCDRVACNKGKCQPPACNDLLANQDETDTDCGGSCTPCHDDQRCKVAADCQSGVCRRQTLRCAAPACNDGVLNGSEPTVDCGAACSNKCQELAVCSSAADCESGVCLKETCVPAAPSGQTLPTVGWLITASDSLNINPIRQALDGYGGSDWASGVNRYAGMWIQIDMGKREAFFRLELDTTTASDTADFLNVWISDDGVFTNEVTKNAAAGAQARFDYATPLVARYIKIELPQGAGNWWRVNEIRVKQ